MATYNIKYFGEFTTLNETDCRLEILEKEYTGQTYSLEFAANPVVLNYSTDDPRSPIRGASLSITIHNVNNSLPITAFYSPADDQFKVRFYRDGLLKFEGFLVQDDCSEVMVDYRHAISLSATDGLGLLKDVPLNSIDPLITVRVWENALVAGNASPNAILLGTSKYRPKVGVQFQVRNHPTLDGTYTPTQVIETGPQAFQVRVAETVSTTGFDPANVMESGIMDFYKRNNLASIIQACLRNTGLELNAVVYSTLFEVTHNADNSFLQQTYEDVRAYLTDKGFDNCYDVLTGILQALRMTIFQANGVWVILRQEDRRLAPITGFVYDPTVFFPLGQTTLSGVQITGPDENIEAQNGLMSYINRPFKFSKETFNYQFPAELIINGTLKRLGALISSSVNGDFKTDVYAFPDRIDWIKYYGDNPTIHVVTQISTDTEVDRYVYQPKITNGSTGYSAFANTEFNDIEVQAADGWDFNLQIRLNSSSSDAVKFRIGFFLRTTETQYYPLQQLPGGNLRWGSAGSYPPIATIGFTYIFPANADQSKWTTFNLSTFATDGIVPDFPATGILTIRIYGTTDTNTSQPNRDALWKGATVNLKAYINQSLKITGHIHNNEQPVEIKNNNDISITVDDSPRNSISGTLLRVSYNGLIQDRTQSWTRKNLSQPGRLGSVITHDELFLRRISRTRLEGSFITRQEQAISPVPDSASAMTPLTLVKYTSLPGLNFVFGRMVINYSEERVEGTLYEAFNDTEQDIDLNNDYEFTYIYDTK